MGPQDQKGKGWITRSRIINIKLVGMVILIAIEMDTMTKYSAAIMKKKYFVEILAPLITMTLSL
jgi:hypothetical protein